MRFRRTVCAERVHCLGKGTGIGKSLVRPESTYPIYVKCRCTKRTDNCRTERLGCTIVSKSLRLRRTTFGDILYRSEGSIVAHNITTYRFDNTKNIRRHGVSRSRTISLSVLGLRHSVETFFLGVSFPRWFCPFPAVLRILSSSFCPISIVASLVNGRFPRVVRPSVEITDKHTQRQFVRDAVLFSPFTRETCVYAKVLPSPLKGGG